MITLSFLALGLALLTAQHAWMAWAAECEAWSQILANGLQRPSKTRYRPHKVHRVISRT